MRLLLAVFLLAAPLARAADPAPGEAAVAPADATTLQIVGVVLKNEIADVDPRLIEPFLAIKLESLPVKLRKKVETRQIEISTLLKLHDTKKKGSLIQPSQDCSEKDFVHPLSSEGIYTQAGYVEINEDELKYVMEKTKCTELDLGCHFTFKIFFTKPKPRVLMFHVKDPLMAMVAQSHGEGAGGNSHFFGIGLTCMH